MNIKNIVCDGLNITVKNKVVSIIGNIDSRQPGNLLKVFFTDLSNEMITNKIKKITIDITKLEFLNSSGIKQFVDWIMSIDNMEDDEKYEIDIITNPELLWQESSISSLIFLNPHYVRKIVSK